METPLKSFLEFSKIYRESMQKLRKVVPSN